MHTIDATITVTIDGQTQTWTANASTELNPHNIARSVLNGLREEAGKDLMMDADRWARSEVIPVLG